MMIRNVSFATVLMAAAFVAASPRTTAAQEKATTASQTSTPTAVAATSTAAPSVVALGELELQMRHAAPDSPAFGQAVSAYWAAIEQSGDAPRAYSFFSALAAEAGAPNATLLASKASATSALVGWLYQNKLQEQFGAKETETYLQASKAEFEQALALDPDNFSALYGYAVMEGHMPSGKAHQKDLLARLDAQRAAKPYLPWAMVDQMEKSQ